MSNISVIIPSADREELLVRAVNSVLGQTLQPESIIIVDNGRSPIKRSFDSEKVSIIRTAPRIGPGMSRNIGVLNSTSEFVAFLDDDDVWNESYLEKSMDIVLHHGSDVVVGELLRKDLSGDLKPYKLFPHNPLDQREVYFRNPGFGGQNFIIRRSLFLDLGGFNEKMPASVDRDLAARILQRGVKIYVQPLSKAILCDHVGERVRQSQVRGNFIFIKNHWRHMRYDERVKALKTYFKRYLRSILNQ